MISLTLKLILHITENDSEYRDVAPLIASLLHFLALNVLPFIKENDLKTWQKLTWDFRAL